MQLAPEEQAIIYGEHEHARESQQRPISAAPWQQRHATEGDGDQHQERE